MMTTIQIKKTDLEILESLKEHPRQPMHEIISELIKWKKIKVV